jgi:hypothetical protein
VDGGAAVAVGAASLRVTRSAAVRVPLSCPAVRARACAGAVRVAAGAGRRGAGRAARFRVRPGARAVAVVRVPAVLRRTLARRRTVGATVTASDDRGVLERTTRRVTLRRG